MVQKHQNVVVSPGSPKRGKTPPRPDRFQYHKRCSPHHYTVIDLSYILSQHISCSRSRAAVISVKPSSSHLPGSEGTSHLVYNRHRNECNPQ